MKQTEDTGKIRVMVVDGDNIQKDVVVDLESVRYDNTPESKATEAMMLLAEAAEFVAKHYHVAHGYHIRI